MWCSNKLDIVLVVSLICAYSIEVSVVSSEACKPVDASNCYCRTDSGYEIDLKPLASPSSPRFTFVSNTSYTYSYNPCNPFTAGSCSAVAICQSNSKDQYTIGWQSTVEYKEFSVSQEHTLTLVYQADAGPQCPDQHVRFGFIRLICQHNQPDLFSFDSETQPCHYNFTLRSAYACAQSTAATAAARLSIGSILLIVLLVVTVLYLFGGVVLMRYWRGARGLDQIPNYDFWKSVPGLVKDGCVLTLTSVGCCKQHRLYSQI